MKTKKKTTTKKTATTATPPKAPAPATTAAPARSPHFDLGTATPDKSVALRLTLPVPYKLLGYFSMSGSAGGTAFVTLEPGANSPLTLGPTDNPARYATFDVPDPKKGLVLLGHYFGQDQFEDARMDFMRRSNLDVLNSRRR